MRMRPLILDERALQLVKAVTQYAADHRINMHGVIEGMKPGTPPAGDDPNHCCIIPFGYRCVFSIEQQGIGWCRHLSVSVPGPGTAPNEHAVSALMEAFGMRGPYMNADKIWTEDIAPQKIAVNVLQRMDPTT